MKFLLDINVMLAANWREHPQYQQATDWLAGKNAVLCPLTEMGFLRISTQPKAFNTTMTDARTLLEKFYQETGAEFIPCDVRTLETDGKKSDEVTDSYLAALAERHGLKLATLDAGIKHPAAVLISSK